MREIAAEDSPHGFTAYSGDKAYEVVLYRELPAPRFVKDGCFARVEPAAGFMGMSEKTVDAYAEIGRAAVREHVTKTNAANALAMKAPPREKISIHCFQSTDYHQCKVGDIAVMGGQEYEIAAAEEFAVAAAAPEDSIAEPDDEKAAMQAFFFANK